MQNDVVEEITELIPVFYEATIRLMVETMIDDLLSTLEPCSEERTNAFQEKWM